MTETVDTEDCDLPKPLLICMSVISYVSGISMRLIKCNMETKNEINSTELEIYFSFIYFARLVRFFPKSVSMMDQCGCKLNFLQNLKILTRFL